MSTLEEVLQKPEYAELPDADSLEALLDPAMIPQPSILYTMSGVGKAFALAGINQSILFAVGTFIKSLVGGESLYEFLMSSGKCDFTELGIQQQLAYNAQLEAGNEARLAAVNVLISLGAPRSSYQWDAEGLGDAPTLESIQAARVEIAKAVERLKIAHFMNEVFQPAIQRGDSIEELQALAADADNWIP
jgi:hypothetical protein